MKDLRLSKTGAELIIPAPNPASQDVQAALLALKQTTHLAIGAHPDDNEIMAYSGIAECYRSSYRFVGVVITDGAGGTKEGPYAGMSDQELASVRVQELKKAAVLGDFLALFYFNYTSAELKSTRRADVTQDLVRILDAVRPRVVYVHNLFDEHDTHVAAVLRSIEALRELRHVHTPDVVYGCQVSGSLDWFPEKVRLDVSKHPAIARQILHIFESQSENNRSYPWATLCRREADAIFDRQNKQGPRAIWYAMNLTMLVTDPSIQLGEFIGQKIDEFRLQRIRQLEALL